MPKPELTNMNNSQSAAIGGLVMKPKQNMPKQPNAVNEVPAKIVFTLPNLSMMKCDVFAVTTKKDMPKTCMTMKSDSSPPNAWVTTVVLQTQ